MDLRKYSEQHKGELNTVERVPRQAIWMGIQQEMKRRKRRIFIMRFSAAASVLLLISAAFVIGLNLNTNSGNESFLAGDSEFTKQEHLYYQLASDKKEQLDYSSLDRATYGDIIQELELLDSMYTDLKNELSKSPDAQQAINTAIKFHERRLHILELLEREIENHKRERQDENPIEI